MMQFNDIVRRSLLKRKRACYIRSLCIHRARYNITRLRLKLYPFLPPRTNGKTSVARLFTVRLKYANNQDRRTKLVTFRRSSPSN